MPGRAATGAMTPAATVIVVMGVSGSGKSTVAAALATRLGWDLGEGDALHPAANVAKMAAGTPLTDADRAPWLALVRGWIDRHLAAGRDGVIACSALQRAYRDVLRRPGVLFVLLDVPPAELERRLATRVGHFMPAALLASQLATLERPGPDEHALTVPTGSTPDATAEQVAASAGLGGGD